MIDLDKNRLPKHVAIIMDGNGRWAKQKNLSRSEGHVEGVKRVEEVVDMANDLNIMALTLFTFSTENWNRPENEVSLLMSILSTVLARKLKKLKNDNIRFQVIGRIDDLPAAVSDVMKRVNAETQDNTGLQLNLAVNYGSRLEILDAVKDIASKVDQGELKIENINEELFSNSLYTKGLPDPDLLIRTSGERRISNFLLWQLSYAEFYFTESNWPDFNCDEFKKALLDYQSRERRYGRVNAQQIEQ